MVEKTSIDKMKEEPQIKIKVDGITAFLHIPVEASTISIKNPTKEGKKDDNKIFLPEAIFKEYREFILRTSPTVYQILQKGIQEEHGDKEITFHFIILRKNYEEFIEFIKDFEKKYAVTIGFGNELYSYEKILEKKDF